MGISPYQWKRIILLVELFVQRLQTGPGMNFFLLEREFLHERLPACRHMLLNRAGMAQGCGRSGESSRLRPMWPGFDSRTRRHMWVEFVVGSLLCSERFFSGYSGFLLSSKTTISKFQFDLDYCEALYHELLVRVIAQVLPVFDILNLHNLLNW